jgi:hypothetical protein
VHGPDPAVVPVRVRIGREEERRGERRELDRGGDGEDRDKSRSSASDEEERGEIREKGRGEEPEEEPGPASDPVGVVGREEGVAGPSASQGRGEKK